MEEALIPYEHEAKGGWKTAPFILGAAVGAGIAVNGVLYNLQVYLIRQYNMGSIEATQVFNVVSGCINLGPIVGAVASDSWFGCYVIVAVATAACFLGTLVATLTSKIRSLRPVPCSEISCESATAGQLTVLYSTIALMAVGIGGTRFNAGTMGANQFNTDADRATFFNWFFVVIYVAAIIGRTGVVYVQDNAGWAWGFGLCAGITGIGMWLFLHGTLSYRHAKPRQNPFVAYMHVVVSAFENSESTESSECYYRLLSINEDTEPTPPRIPSQSFSFLNRAVIDTKNKQSCTVEQVEDLKTLIRLIRLIPLVSTFLLLSTSVTTQNSLSTLQALVMDRSIAGAFSIPAGSISVFVLVTATLAISFLDRAVYPAWQKITNHNPSTLQRIGLGHLVNVLAMACSALVESKRLKALQGSMETMSVLWLVPPLVLIGVGEAFHFPGQVMLYYQEFPASLCSTATSMEALTAGLGYYLGTGIVAAVRSITGWLEDDMNQSRLDNVYWMLAVMSLLNFAYYFFCASRYKKQHN